MALGRAISPAEGLAALDAVDRARLGDFLPYHAARADLLVRAGRAAEAERAYEAALALDPEPAEAHYLTARRNDCATPADRKA